MKTIQLLLFCFYNVTNYYILNYAKTQCLCAFQKMNDIFI